MYFSFVTRLLNEGQLWSSILKASIYMICIGWTKQTVELELTISLEQDCYLQIRSHSWIDTELGHSLYNIDHTTDLERPFHHTVETVSATWQAARLLCLACCLLWLTISKCQCIKFFWNKSNPSTCDKLCPYPDPDPDNRHGSPRQSCSLADNILAYRMAECNSDSQLMRCFWYRGLNFTVRIQEIATY